MQSIDNEIWKPIEGYEGLYEVSSRGRVRTLGRTVQTGLFVHGQRKQVSRSYPSKILSPHSVGGYDGYLSCTLHKQGKERHALVHRLVAEAFIPNPENKPEVNHKDRNKQNNQVDNLEWCTRIENIRHAKQQGVDFGSGRRGKRNSDYHNKRISETHKGKVYSSEAIDKLRCSHVNQSIKLKCNETGEEFISISDAGRKIGADPATIRDSMKYGWKVHHQYTFIEI